MVNPNQENLYKLRIPQNMRINKDLLHKERHFLLRNERQLYTTIKTPKSSQIEVHIISPALAL